MEENAVNGAGEQKNILAFTCISMVISFTSTVNLVMTPIVAIPLPTHNTAAKTDDEHGLNGQQKT